jgi:hypothetical protein
MPEGVGYGPDKKRKRPNYKLREKTADALERLKEEGDITRPTPEQLDKMIERLDKERSKPRPSKRRRPSSKKTFPKSVKKKKPPDPKVLWFAGELIAEEKAKRKAAKAKRKAAILKAEKLARRQIRDGIVSKDAVLRAMRENKEVGAEDIAEGQRRALTRKAPLDPRASGFPDLSRKRKRTNI